MYRSKGSKSPKAKAPPSKPAEEKKDSMPAEMVDAMVSLKQAYTAPSMIYDSASKRIVINPAYNRETVSSLSRLQGQLVSVLRHAQQHNQQCTPKELLVQIEKALLILLVSTIGSSSSAMFDSVSDEVDAERRIPQLEMHCAHNTVPARAMLATAYAISEGVVETSIDSFLEMVTARLAEEMAPETYKRRTEMEQQALQSTKHNIDDLRKICDALRVYYKGIQTTSQLQRPQAMDGDATKYETSARANAQSAKLLAESYYSLTRWVRAVDAERIALRNGGSASSAAEEDALPAVTVKSYDPISGKAVFQRRAGHTSWGVEFNQTGMFVGMSNSTSNATEAGRQLFEALQYNNEDGSNGFVVTEINRRRIRSSDMTPDEVMRERGTIIRNIQESVRAASDSLSIVFASASKRNAHTAAREVLFEAVSQGKEMAVGQRALLVLRRASENVPWGVKFDMKDGKLLLVEFSDKTRLGDASRTFLFDHRERLEVVTINSQSARALGGNAAASKKKMMESIKEGVVLSLWLQVISASSISTTAKQAAVDEADVAAETEEAGKVFDANYGATEIEAEANEVIEEPAAAEAIEDADDDAVQEDVIEEKGEEEDVAPVQEEEPMAADDEDANIEGNDWSNPSALSHDEDEKDRLDREDRAHRELLDEYAIPKDEALPEEMEENAAIPSQDENTVDVEEEQEDAALAENDVNEEVHRLIENGDEQIDADEGKMPPLESDAPLVFEEHGPLVPTATDDKKKTKKVTEKKGKTAKKKKETAKSKAAKNKKKKSKKGKKKGDANEDDEEWQDDKEAEEATANETGEKETLQAAETVEPIEDNAEPTQKAIKKKDKKKKSVAEIVADEPNEGVDVIDKPLVELSTTADAAMKIVEEALAEKKNSKKKQGKASEESIAAEEVPSHATLHDVVDAPPLKFKNDVVINKFDGTTMELQRKSINDSWEIKVALVGNEVLITKLPPLDVGNISHPYLRYLQAEPNGEVNCAMESINGKDLTLLSKTDRSKALSMIKQATNISLALKVIKRR